MISWRVSCRDGVYSINRLNISLKPVALSKNSQSSEISKSSTKNIFCFKFNLYLKAHLLP